MHQPKDSNETPQAPRNVAMASLSNETEMYDRKQKENTET